MNPRPHNRKIVASLCAAALVCAASGVSAQMVVVYKQVDQTGRVLYADRTEVPSSPDAFAAEDAPAASGKRPPARRSSLVTINEAQRRLAQAELKRKQGTAPLPAERMQGSGELTYAYWRRQEKLRIEVEQAQRRVNAVQRPMLAGDSKM